MTTPNAIFLIGLFAVAVGLSIVAFTYKYMILYMVSGLMWSILGISRLTDRTWNLDITLGIFCMLVAVALFLAPIYTRKRAEVATVVKKTRAEQIDETTKKYRKARGRGKVAQGWWQK